MIFDQQKQVVPKIQIGFERTNFLECASAKMKDPRCSTNTDSMAAIFKAPAQIDFFHVRKKISIQSSNFMKGFSSNEQSGSGSPENFTVGSVLSSVRFENFKNATRAKSIAIFIDETTCSTSILQKFRVRVVANDGLACRKTFFFHCLEDRSNPIRRYANIAVEEDVIFSIDLRESGIVTTCEPQVFLQSNDFNARKCLLAPYDGLI